MNKNDLKTGMILEFNNGDKAMVLLGTQKGDVFSGDTWGILENLNNELEELNRIVPRHVKKIYQSKWNRDYLINGISTQLADLIWEKPNNVHILRKRLLKKQLVNEAMFAELTPEETMELAKLLTEDYNNAVRKHYTGGVVAYVGYRD